MNAIVIEGQIASFQCSSDGVPTPVQVWLNGSSEVQAQDSGRIFVAGDFLLIFDIEQSDDGEYTCRATNEAGQDEATADLTVVGKMYLHTGGQPFHTFTGCTHTLTFVSAPF